MRPNSISPEKVKKRVRARPKKSKIEPQKSSRKNLRLKVGDSN